ncbi:MAG: DUF484 family protein [Proteobacteria bacterium]|nr:DUF484 family protein [Pseudomonadota bacterium]
MAKKPGPDSDRAAPISNSELEARIADYLRDNPDYLAKHPELLETLTPPSRWSGDGVVDMQAFMLDRLKGEAESLRESATDLVYTARSNMLVQTRTHAAALALLGSGDYAKLAHVACFDLPLLLDVDVVTVCLEDDGAGAKAALAPDEFRPLAAGAVDEFLGPRDEVRLVENTADDGMIFGEAAGLVRSAALARLYPGGGQPPGMLALGAREVSTFNPSQATELLSFLARVLDDCLKRWLIPKA